MLGYVVIPAVFYVVAFLLLAASSLLSFISQKKSGSIASKSNELLHDSLTHLPNHTLFIDHLEYAYAVSKRHKKALAVINLDVDKFSEINRHYGYKKGDTLIIDIATRLRDLVRESDTVARLGGSAFGLIMSLIEHEDEVDRALQRIIKGMQEPFIIKDENIVLNTSYGICVYPTDE
ncbi:MAG: GGDEF domain-containing protein, partial [Gammaproteobacteria bacterium]|nr:GGDEF domain-containing protein [Gammaproteobacteria bacterium]